MARIAGVDLPGNKHIEVALTYIYGVGDTISKKLLAATKIDPFTKANDLTEAQVLAIREALKQFAIEGELRKDLQLNVKRLVDIGAYRGTRHKKGLPARGQRTRTNGRTKRGKRKTVGGKKKEEK
jgi:small subunit ribosomal protein S13